MTGTVSKLPTTTCGVLKPVKPPNTTDNYHWSLSGQAMVSVVWPVSHPQCTVSAFDCMMIGLSPPHPYHLPRLSL